MIELLSLGEEITKNVIDFQMEIRKTYYFMKDGFEIIENRIKEADDYYKEFEFEIDWLRNNLDKIRTQDPIAIRVRSLLDKIDMVARLYEFADTQQELAYRMAHVFMIAIYEAFIKELFKKLYNFDSYLMISKRYTSKKIKRMSPNELEELISKKLRKIGNVDKLNKTLSKPDFNIDVNAKFPKWSGLRENYYRRHVIIHNHGIYDRDYVNKTNSSKKLIGTEIETDLQYIKDLAHNICNFIAFLGGQIMGSYAFSISGKNIEEQAKEILNKLDKHKKV